MTRSFSKPVGFTIVELLVVVAIIGVLVGMLLPAVNRAREAAWRTQCINNVKNLATALTIHETSQGSLPPGVPNCAKNQWASGGIESGAVCQGPNWMGSILTELEERKKHEILIDCMEQASNVSDYAGCAEVSINTPSVLRCPSVPSDAERFPLSISQGVALAKGNYGANFGAGFYINNPDVSRLWDGTFGVVALSKTYNSTSEATQGIWKAGYGRGTRMADIFDGTSKTMLISEILGVPSAADGRGAWLWGGMGGAAFSAYRTPNARPTPYFAADDYNYPPDSDSSNDEAVGTDVIAFCESNMLIPNKSLKCTENSTDGRTYAAARSVHPGGVVIGNADSSVRFLTDEVDPMVWRAMATKSGPTKEPEVVVQ